MDLIKQYIMQSISAASNNLRLSTQKIEVVALLREEISKSADLENDIKEMKKITELSKFAIKLHEIYNFLTQPYIDFFKISDKFREHSQHLIKELSILLENVNPASFKNALGKLHPHMEEETVKEYAEVIDLDLSKRVVSAEMFEQEAEIRKTSEVLSPEESSFEAEILKPIKPLDNFLKEMDSANPDKDELAKFTGLMNANGILSAERGFDILAGMHEIIAESLNLIALGKLTPDKKIIDSIRSCLIVIVAVVKDKKIDVTPYLERAEEFGNNIKNLN